MVKPQIPSQEHLPKGLAARNILEDIQSSRDDTFGSSNPKTDPKRDKCSTCPSTKGKTTIKCNKRKNYVCKQLINYICPNCYI